MTRKTKRLGNTNMIGKKLFRNAVCAVVLVALCGLCTACGKKAQLRHPDGSTYPSTYPSE